MTSVLAGESTDSAVIAASRRDPERFAVIYDRYAAQLYRYAHRRVGAEAAEDVVADTFLAAFRARSRYDTDRADARPWLFGIVTKEISRRHRSETSRYRALARAADEPAGAGWDAGMADRVAAAVTARAARTCLAGALATLSTGDRHVLLLFAWAGLSYEEIATALHIPVGTVRSRLNRARRKTRAALGGADPTEERENEK